MTPAAGTAGTPTATASVEVDASPAAAYAVLVDLDTLAALAEETESMAWVRGDTARPGAVFTGANRNGRHRWSTRCTVTDADPGRRFAFDVRFGPVPVARWQYDVEPLRPDHHGAERCRVTESTWDRRPGPLKVPMGWSTGVSDRATASQAHIEATLERLRAHLA